MSKENPESFADLDVAALRTTAIEDFAVDIKATDNKPTVLAALLESGVEWNTYAELKGLNVVPEPTPVFEAVPDVLVDTAPEEVEIITAGPLAPARTQKYLLKMERANVRFDIRGHRFTQEHPYALVSAADVDYITSKEKGFRMAYPAELEEFYG